LGQDLRAAGFELHFLEDQDVAALDDDLALVGAPVFVLEAVVRLRFVRATVPHVRNAIAVVVRLGAAVLVLEAVEVLRIVRALIFDVGDAVLVVVRIGAPVLILEPVLVLGDVGALVLRVGNAVAVPVSVPIALGAAVLAAISVRVLGTVRAASV